MTERSLPPLTPDDRRRYSRHLILSEVGEEGQRRLKDARVALVGMGGLGSPAALYLAAAGVGTLGLIDDDTVELSNLQRQIIHGSADVGRPKIESARDRIREVNPDVQVKLHPVRLTSENAMEVLADYDIVLDGSDNFPTRYLVNDACVLLGKPFVYGAILRFDGQVSVFGMEGGPCYRCLFREPPPPDSVPGCAEAGVLGVLPGIVGSLQAMEAIKWILGRDTMAGTLLLYDALEPSWRTMELRRDPDCPVCGNAPTVTELIDYERFCGMAGEDPDEGVPETSATELRDRLEAGEDIVLIDVREPHEWELVNLEDRGARLIPQGEVLDAAEELKRSEGAVVLYCRSGGRSRRMAGLLREAGVQRVENLTGGILGWQEAVDPSLPRY